MTGHARERSPGRWELKAYAGRDHLTGRKRYATKTVSASSKKAADKQLAAFVTDVARKGAPGDDCTLGELLERWFELRKASWTPKGQREVRRVIDQRLAPMANARVSKIRTADLDHLYAQLREHGRQRQPKPTAKDPRPKPKPLAASTVRRVHAVLRAALEQAVTWELLDRNPAVKASPGRVDEAEVVPPTAAHLGELFAAAEAQDPSFAVFLILAAVTGARRGELIVLRDSDFEDGYRIVTFRRRVSDGQEIPLTKTRKVRRISLGEATAALLVEHRERRVAAAAAEGRVLPANARLFGGVDGDSFWPPDSVSRWHRKLCRRLGLPPIRLHDLRHYVVTTLLTSGVDQRTTMGRTGHASLASLQRYAHFLEPPDKAAADLLDGLVATPFATPFVRVPSATSDSSE